MTSHWEDQPGWRGAHVTGLGGGGGVLPALPAPTHGEGGAALSLCSPRSWSPQAQDEV